jgi:hypothetical protein
MILTLQDLPHVTTLLTSSNRIDWELTYEFRVLYLRVGLLRRLITTLEAQVRFTLLVDAILLEYLRPWTLHSERITALHKNSQSTVIVCVYKSWGVG